MPPDTVIAHAGAADESLAVVMIVAGLWLGWIGRSRLRGTGFPKLSRRLAWAMIGLALVLVVASAVAPRAIYPRPAAAPTASGPRLSSTATLAFVSPAEGAIVHGEELDVVLSLEGGSVVDGSAAVVTPDTGHIHLSVDGKLVSMTYGTVQVVDLRPYGAGSHALEAEYVAADHLPFSPAVSESVTFTVGSAA